MVFTRIREMTIVMVLAMSLFTASFAAPLCACLSTTVKTQHDCCEKMQGHCPLKGHLKGHTADPAEPAGDSFEKTPHSGCACSVEKQENTPSKISDAGNTQQEIPALAATVFPVFFTAQTETAKTSFHTQAFTEKHFSSQTPARAPPGL